MNVTIVRTYEEEIEIGDPYVDLIDNENGDVILSGDYYHDRIEQLIEGFICGVLYLGKEIKINHVDTTRKEENDNVN
jgi:hypothetical protein